MRRLTAKPAPFAVRRAGIWRLKMLNLKFPEAAGTFSCTINAPITEKDTPRLYMLMRRALMDAGLSTYRAKNEYKRTRPFVVNKESKLYP